MLCRGACLYVCRCSACLLHGHVPIAEYCVVHGSIAWLTSRTARATCSHCSQQVSKTRTSFDSSLWRPHFHVVCQSPVSLVLPKRSSTCHLTCSNLYSFTQSWHSRSSAMQPDTLEWLQVALGMRVPYYWCEYLGCFFLSCFF